MIMMTELSRQTATANSTVKIDIDMVFPLFSVLIMFFLLMLYDEKKKKFVLHSNGIATDIQMIETQNTRGKCAAKYALIYFLCDCLSCIWVERSSTVSHVKVNKKPNFVLSKLNSS